MSRPRDIGTRAESAIRKVCQASGFPYAERNPLYGAKDRGDINITPGVICEVKAGRAAETASDNQIVKWLGELETARVNAGALFAILVTKRAGIGHGNAHRWWAHTTLDGLFQVVDVPMIYPTDDLHVRLTLADMLTLLKREGW